MSDAIETKVLSMLDALQNGAVELGGQIVKYTPDVVNAVLDVTVIAGSQNIVTGLFWLILAIVTARICFKTDWGKTYDDITCDQVKKLLFGAVAIVSSLVTTYYLLDVWNYVAIISPKLYIAHQIIEKATAVAH